MRCASIDIGTNTLRLLIAEGDKKSGIKHVLYKRAITRLGGSYTEDKGLNEDAAERTLKALEDFRSEIERAGVAKVVNAATSVVRRAVNKDWFVKEAIKRANIEPTVISGDEEARLAVLGVLSVVEKDAAKNTRRLIFDIGGGSTEFIMTEGMRPVSAWSMELGVVHLTEDHLKSDPPDANGIREMEERISDVIDGVKGLFKKDGHDAEEFFSRAGSELVGTAGTITTLAALDQDLDKYDRNKINNYVLKKERVSSIYERLKSMTLKERTQVLSLEKGREDLIIPGSAITLKAMDAFGFDSIKVSDAGLLEGLIIRELGLSL